MSFFLPYSLYMQVVPQPPAVQPGRPDESGLPEQRQPQRARVLRAAAGQLQRDQPQEAGGDERRVGGRGLGGLRLGQPSARLGARPSAR